MIEIYAMATKHQIQEGVKHASLYIEQISSPKAHVVTPCWWPLCLPPEWVAIAVGSLLDIDGELTYTSGPSLSSVLEAIIAQCFALYRILINAFIMYNHSETGSHILGVRGFSFMYQQLVSRSGFPCLVLVL